MRVKPVFSSRFLQISILVAFVLFTAVVISQTIAVQHRLSEKTACQANYNAKFGAAITQRAKANTIIQSAADQDRANIVSLITTISTAKSGTVVEGAIKTYLQEAAVTQMQRDAAISTQQHNPIPDVSQLQSC